jgi:hypothetical protein
MGQNFAEVPQKEDLFQDAFIYSEITQLSSEDFEFIDFYAVKSSAGHEALANTNKPLDTDNKVLVVIPIPIQWSTVEPTWITAIIDINSLSESISEYHNIISLTSAFTWGGRNTSANMTNIDEDFDSSWSHVDDFLDADVPERLRTRRHLRFTHAKLFDLNLAQNMFAAAVEADSVVEHRTDPFLKRRRLEDTYASSLLHVNRLLNKEFGTENRKVPAHMPHLIDIDIMNEMQLRWEALWNETSAHRFRSPRDMQYAFSYYHYVMNRYSAHPPDLAAFLADAIDTNGDGYIDNNEFRTLAAIVNARVLSPEKVQAFRDCAFPTVREEISVRQSADREVEERLIIKAPRTIKSILNCSIIVTALTERFKNSRYPLVPPAYTVGAEEDVVFEMIYDNVSLTMEKLDSVRWRRSKFICLNDNVQHYTPDLSVAVRDFFEAMYPIPSRFELPKGKSNPTLYTDEYTKLEMVKTKHSFTSAPLIDTLLLAFNEIVYNVNLFADNVLKPIIDTAEFRSHRNFALIISCSGFVIFLIWNWITGKNSSPQQKTETAENPEALDNVETMEILPTELGRAPSSTRKNTRKEKKT